MISLELVLKTLGLAPSSQSCFFDRLCQDTRQIQPDHLFIALPGQRLSAEELTAQALANGAKGVITSCPSTDPRVFTVPCVQKALDLLCPLFYPRLPSHLLAVTGTDGKTSVTHLWHQLWTFVQRPSALVGTLGVRSVPDLQDLPSFPGLTTPPCLSLYHILEDCSRQGIDHVAFEASSHALAQNRLGPLKASQGLWTTFTQDHLDYHKTRAAYFQAKSILFTHVVTQDAILFNGLPPEVQEKCQSLNVVWYGPEDQARPHARNATYRILSRSPFTQRVLFALDGVQWESEIPLIGAFQINNLLGALCAFSLQGGSLQEVIPFLPHLKPIKGRMEDRGSFQGGRIFIDFAHTPSGLEHALQTLRPYTQGKLGVVFGCGGERDQEKRAVMGAVAHQYADWVFVTDDNPRSEDPASIRKAILSTCPRGKEAFPREQAILEAMKALKEGDILLIAGKGHEEIQIIGTAQKPFSDHAWIRVYQERFSHELTRVGLTPFPKKD